MTRRLGSAVLFALLPVAAGAQGPSPRLEVSGSVAVAKVFRVEDESFGAHMNPGAGVEVRVGRRFGVGVEFNRVMGLEPQLMTCDSVPGVTCTGSGRRGVLETAMMSATAAWYFNGTARVQPYVIGGVDVMWSRTVSTFIFGSGATRTITDREARGHGYGITAGGGLRLPIGSRVVLRPEWRIYDGSLMGRANLSAMRVSAAIGYVW